MTIDIERLAVDLDYWNAVAPEGATHLINKNNFAKWIDGIKQDFVEYEFKANQWEPSNYNWSLEKYTKIKGFHVIAKPTKPAAPEWDGAGLPPVGCECEVIESDGLMYGQGELGEVIAHVENTAVIRMSYGLGCFEARHLRPIRSQAERERDTAIDHAFSKLTEFREARQVLGDLYDAGLLPKVSEHDREEIISDATKVMDQDWVLTEKDAAIALYEAGLLRKTEKD